MRIVICYMSVMLTALLVGCGQTGALQLPNDPNHDKRAQYLLYKEKSTQTAATEVQITPEQADKQAAASELIDTH